MFQVWNGIAKPETFVLTSVVRLKGKLFKRWRGGLNVINFPLIWSSTDGWIENRFFRLCPWRPQNFCLNAREQARATDHWKGIWRTRRSVKFRVNDAALILGIVVQRFLILEHLETIQILSQHFSLWICCVGPCWRTRMKKSRASVLCGTVLSPEEVEEQRGWGNRFPFSSHHLCLWNGTHAQHPSPVPLQLGCYSFCRRAVP